MIGYVIVSVLPLFKTYPLCPKNRIFIVHFFPRQHKCSAPLYTVPRPSIKGLPYLRSGLSSHSRPLASLIAVALPSVTLQNHSKYYFVYRRAVLVYTEFGGEILARSGITSVKSAEFDIAAFIGNSL